MSDNLKEVPGHRERYIFHGSVQGVGFRYTTVSIARRFAVKGYVKNLPDGTVELVVEGSPSAVRDFLNEIASALANHISERECTAFDSAEMFAGFEIRF